MARRRSILLRLIGSIWRHSTLWMLLLGLVAALVLLTVEPAARWAGAQIERWLPVRSLPMEQARNRAALEAELSARAARIAMLEQERDALIAERNAAENERDRLAAELAAAQDRAAAMAAAVAAARAEVAERARIALGNFGNEMRAETLPWFGTVAIVTATRRHWQDRCADLRALDRLVASLDAAQPEADVAAAACTATVPPADELWAQVRAEPLAGWQRLRTAGYDLPEIARDGPLDFLLQTIDGLGAWLDPEAVVE